MTGDVNDTRWRRRRKRKSLGVEDRFRRLEYRSESDLSYDESKRSETILLKRCDFENIPEERKILRDYNHNDQPNKNRIVCV